MPRGFGCALMNVNGFHSEVLVVTMPLETLATKNPPILEGYSTMCHLCWKDSEEQRFVGAGLFLCFSVLLHAGPFKHSLVSTSRNDRFNFLFLLSDTYIHWTVITEII